MGMERMGVGGVLGPVPGRPITKKGVVYGTFVPLSNGIPKGGRHAMPAQKGHETVGSGDPEPGFWPRHDETEMPLTPRKAHGPFLDHLFPPR